MAHTIPCEKCKSLGGNVKIVGEYPNGKAINEICRFCSGTGRVIDPNGR